MPKGYVDFLETQQKHLAAGLREMYHRLVAADSWTEQPLTESADGEPLLHEILAALNLPEDSPGSTAGSDFEANIMHMQERRGGAAGSIKGRQDSLTAGSNSYCDDEDGTQSSPFMAGSDGIATVETQQPQTGKLGREGSAVSLPLHASGPGTGTGTWWTNEVGRADQDAGQAHHPCRGDKELAVTAPRDSYQSWYTGPTIDTGTDLMALGINELDLWMTDDQYMPELMTGIVPTLSMPEPACGFLDSGVLGRVDDGCRGDLQVCNGEEPWPAIG